MNNAVCVCEKQVFVSPQVEDQVVPGRKLDKYRRPSGPSVDPNSIGRLRSIK